MPHCTRLATNLFVVFSFVVSIPLPVLAATVSIDVDGTAVVLTDVPADAWFAEHVEQVAATGIMQGYRDAQGKPTGNFGPANPVTRAEFLKMVAVMMVYRYDFDRSFQPLGDRWFDHYRTVVQSTDPELPNVMPTDDASMNKPILRHEAAGLLHLGLGNYDVPKAWDKYPLFSDVSRESSNAFAIAELRYFEVLKGDGETGLFHPERTLNRAEAAKILVTTATEYQTPLGPEQETSGESSIVEGEEDAWQTYKSKEFGVTFRHPDTVRVEIEGGVALTLYSAAQSMAIVTDPKPAATLEEWWKAAAYPEPIPKEMIVIGDEKGQRVEVTSIEGDASDRIFVIHQERGYVFHIPSAPEETFLQILETVRFLP